MMYFSTSSSARAVGKSLVVPSGFSSAMVTTAAAAGKAKMTAMATTAAAGMAEGMAEMQKKVSTITADDNDDTCKAIVLAALPAPAAQERPSIFIVISRLADRPFLGTDASDKLSLLGKKLAKKMAVETARTMIKTNVRQLLDDLDAAFQQAELALDDIEQQHLCLQALIMSHQDDKKTLASKMRFGVRRSRMRGRIERRQEEVQGIVNRAYRRVLGSMKKSKLEKYY